MLRIANSRSLPDVVPELKRQASVENPEQRRRGQRPVVLVYYLSQYALKYVGRYFNCQKRLDKVQIGGPRADDMSPPRQVAMESHWNGQKTVTEEDGGCWCMQQWAIMSLYNNTLRQGQVSRSQIRPSRGAHKQVFSQRKTFRLKSHQLHHGTDKPLQFRCAVDCKHIDVHLDRKRCCVRLCSRLAFPHALCFTLKPDYCRVFRER